MMNHKKIYFRSDFDFYIDVADLLSEAVPLGDIDFRAIVTTDGHGRFVAQHKGDQFQNCALEGKRIHVFADNHGLGLGPVRVCLELFVPAPSYPDGIRTITSRSETEYELSTTPTENSTFEINVEAPLVTVHDPETIQSLAAKQDRLTTTDDLALSDDAVLSLTDMAKMRLFIDQWNVAAGSAGCYNAETGFFELNGLTDITYEQAIRIMQTMPMISNTPTGSYYPIVNKGIRTTLPLIGSGNLFGAATLLNTFKGCSELEDVRIYNGNIVTYTTTFYRCHKLKTCHILPQYACSFSGDVFQECAELENLRIGYLKSGLNLSWSPNISLASLQYIVQDAANTSAITITVHATVYSKLTDESNEEWHALLKAAAAKNISFAKA